MGQIRKDILNGWKEIGAYVSRDIRTVERWEKQRGLPVRRMPGTGRATVYALTSELDQWLENDGLENGPESDNRVELQTGPIDPASPPPIAGASGAVQHNRRAGNIGSSFAISKPDRPPAHDVLERRAAAVWSRYRLRSVAAVAISLVAIGALAWPALRGRTKLFALTSPASAHAYANSTIPYRSQVPGVDDLYLRGIYAYEQRTPESLQRSLEDFSDAVAKDPAYAPAYAGMANTYNLLREYSMMPDAEAYPRAKQAAEHAVMLDPRLPEAHASLGFIDFFWSWDATAAEREFQTAITLDPNSAVAHHWYGSMLMHQGRFTEAIEQLDMAQHLQPNSAAILSTRALAMGLNGRRSEAVEMLKDAIQVTPTSSSPHAFLATLSNVEPREPARYLAEMRLSATLRHDSEALQVANAATGAFRAGDETRMWSAILATEEKLHPEAGKRTYLMAEAEAALGRQEDAISDLRLLASRHDPSVMGLRIDPVLAPLRLNDQFAQLVSSIGLDPLQR